MVTIQRNRPVSFRGYDDNPIEKITGAPTGSKHQIMCFVKGTEGYKQTTSTIRHFKDGANPEDQEHWEKLEKAIGIIAITIGLVIGYKTLQHKCAQAFENSLNKEKGLIKSFENLFNRINQGMEASKEFIFRKTKKNKGLNSRLKSTHKIIKGITDFVFQTARAASKFTVGYLIPAAMVTHGVVLALEDLVKPSEKTSNKELTDKEEEDICQ